MARGFVRQWYRCSLRDKGVFLSCCKFLLLVSLWLFVASDTFAQSEFDFFEKDEAITIFKAKVSRNQAPKQNSKISISSPQPNDALDNSIPKSLTASEQIISKYGQPDKQIAVLAQDNAPAPYKAMMEALSIGDEKLAYGYAKQYVNYMQQLQSQVKDAVVYMGIAMEESGLSGPNGWQSDPQFEAYRKLVLDDKSASDSNSNLEGARTIPALSIKAKNVLEKVAKEEGFVLNQNKSSANVKNDLVDNEAQLRLQAQKTIYNKARPPVDPTGEIDIYFFFRPKDKDSLAMARSVQKFYFSNKANSKIRIVGLTMELESLDTVQAFRALTGVNFPIANGSMFAKTFEINSVPTTVGVSRTTGQAIVEQGERSFYYLDELVKIMQGKGG